MSWDSWALDRTTILWIIWMVYFVVLETVTLLQGDKQELTAHLRPVFQSMDLVYFVGIGTWLWVGKHFLLDGLWVTVGWPFLGER
jgi:predicted signal transduction protein with EAL and GGDEF domain